MKKLDSRKPSSLLRRRISAAERKFKTLTAGRLARHQGGRRGAFQLPAVRSSSSD